MVHGHAWWVLSAGPVPFLPEMGRGIVDNRSLPGQGVNRAPLFFVHGSSKVEEGNPLGQRSRLNAPTLDCPIHSSRQKLPSTRMPRWNCGGVAYTTPLITVFEHLTFTGFAELEIGISYLTIGVAVAVGGYPNGKFLERNYQAVVKRIGFTGSTKSLETASRNF